MKKIHNILNAVETPDSPNKLNANIHWSHTFNNIILDGHAKKMGAPCFLVYSIIKAYTDINNGKSFPSVTKIIAHSGFGKTVVTASIAKLETMGFLHREKSGRQNTYTLTEIFHCRNEDNEVVAQASFQYVPNAIKSTGIELKNFLLTGENNSPIIKVEYLTVNVNNNGIQNIGENIHFAPQITGDLKNAVDNLNSSRRKNHQDAQKIVR